MILNEKRIRPDDSYRINHGIYQDSERENLSTKFTLSYGNRYFNFPLYAFLSPIILKNIIVQSSRWLPPTTFFMATGKRQTTNDKRQPTKLNSFWWVAFSAKVFCVHLPFYFINFVTSKPLRKSNHFIFPSW